MNVPNKPSRPSSAWAVAVLLLAATCSRAFGQGVDIDVLDPPGLAEGTNKLGPALGAAGHAPFGPSSGGVVGGRAGPSVTRAPLNSATPTAALRRLEAQPDFKVRAIPEAAVPAYGALELPPAEVPIGPENGYTLDDAVQLLVDRNLELIALRFEVPMADADVLTAGLRSNPVFYADAQLIPYGSYSALRPGGQQQYDVNVTHPLDVNLKRKARAAAARVARSAVEAQLQDAVRNQIDNLYTVFVDVAAAELTLEYSRKYQEGITRLLAINEDLLEKKQIPEDPVFTLRAQQDVSRVQVREAEQALARNTRALARLLNFPREQAASLRIRDKLRDDRPIPMTEGELIDMALERRPDLQAQRVGLQRAHADVRVAQKERLQDLYLLYQPYTFQDNRQSGVEGAYSWALGVTAPMPIYNRNQGNIARAKLNATQTRVELDHAVRLVQDDVADAVQEFELSRQAVIDTETDVLPSARRVRDAAYRRWQGGETNIMEFLESQREFNEHVRAYRDAIVRHRRAVLDLNTAVGARLLP